MKFLPGLCFALVLFTACRQQEMNTTLPLFRSQSPDSTGVHFTNTVADSGGFNIFNYRNFYNGGGVAIGDVNNDGKPDIFFTSNQGKNKLYLNEGGWHFRDAAAAAGIEGIGRWHTGVTMADVNGDGWLDIYVSNSGDPKGQGKANELYINDHNGHFTESAAAYGLADAGIGTQAAFFDYDRDGDLDCFVLTNSFLPTGSFGYNPDVRKIRSGSDGERLYRNDNGHFHDVSAAAGIYGSDIGFGLGLTVGDLNNDGWPDIYVSNDFFEKDYCYINQHDGSFRETIEDAMGHTSLSSMGSDMVDINNDGNLDIFTTDMLPESDFRLKTTTRFDDYSVQNAKIRNDYHHQFNSNCLQLNNGDGTFSEIAAYAGVQSTDWSWGALGFDFDNDGWKDLLVCNGIQKDLTNQDFLAYFSDPQTRSGIVNGGFDYNTFLKEIPGTPVSKYAFLNRHSLVFDNRADSLGLGVPGFSNGAAYGDLDGDGDADLVVNNENAPASLYRNMASETLHHSFLKVALQGAGQNTLGYGARVWCMAGGNTQWLEQMPTRGFESSVEPVLCFGLGSLTKIDSIGIRWPQGKVQIVRAPALNQTLLLKENDAASLPEPPIVPAHSLFTETGNRNFASDIRHNENAYIDFAGEHFIPKMLSTEGPKIAAGDLNGDGLPDLFLGSAENDTAKILLQQPDGHFVRRPQFALNRDKDSEDAGAALVDVDGDGDSDLVVVSGGDRPGQDPLNQLIRLYLNDGKGNFTRSLAGWPVISMNGSCVRPCDFNGDGKPDLFIGARNIPGRYGISPNSLLLQNMGGGRFADVTEQIAPALIHLGMVTDAQWFRPDGKNLALAIVGDWMPLTVIPFTNGAPGDAAPVPASAGWWNCLSVADLDGDGKPDLIAGNNGSNCKLKADADHPARLYAGDFDGNGLPECVQAYFKSDGKSYPLALYDDMMKQIPALKKKFLHYSDYAGKTLEEVFTQEQLGSAEKHSVEEMRSCIFYNQGNGRYVKQPMPQRAQFAPVFTALAADLNGDGRMDLFLGGNFYGLKPEIGRLDASYGVTLIGLGKREFGYVTPVNSGLFVRGEVRDALVIHTNGGNAVIVARNNESPLEFQSGKR